MRTPLCKTPLRFLPSRWEMRLLFCAAIGCVFMVTVTFARHLPIYYPVAPRRLLVIRSIERIFLQSRWLDQRVQFLDARIESLLSHIQDLERERQWAEELNTDPLRCQCPAPNCSNGEGETDPARSRLDSPDRSKGILSIPMPARKPAPSKTLPLPLLPTTNANSSTEENVERATFPMTAKGEIGSHASNETSRNTVAVVTVVIVAPAAVFLGFACLCRRKPRRRHV